MQLAKQPIRSIILLLSTLAVHNFAFGATASPDLSVPPNPGPTSEAEAKALITSGVLDLDAKPEKAIQEFELFRSRYPLDSRRDDAEKMLAGAYEKIENYGKAKEVWKELADKQTDKAAEQGYNLNAAKCQIKLGDLLDAQASLTEILKKTDSKSQTHGEALLAQSEMRYLRNQIAESRSSLDAALGIDSVKNMPESRSLQILVGAKECKKNETWRSLEQCLLLLKKFSTDSDALQKSWCGVADPPISDLLKKLKEAKIIDSVEFARFQSEWKDRLKQEGCAN